MRNEGTEFHIVCNNSSQESWVPFDKLSPRLQEEAKSRFNLDRQDGDDISTQEQQTPDKPTRRSSRKSALNRPCYSDMTKTTHDIYTAFGLDGKTPTQQTQQKKKAPPKKKSTAKKQPAKTTKTNKTTSKKTEPKPVEQETQPKASPTEEESKEAIKETGQDDVPEVSFELEGDDDGNLKLVTTSEEPADTEDTEVSQNELNSNAVIETTMKLFDIKINIPFRKVDYLDPSKRAPSLATDSSLIPSQSLERKVPLRPRRHSGQVKSYVEPNDDPCDDIRSDHVDDYDSQEENEEFKLSRSDSKKKRKHKFVIESDSEDDV